MPSTPTIMDATLLTKIEPVRDAGRIVREARWYVRVIIAHPPDEQDSIRFYRVWRENGEWKSARIEL